VRTINVALSILLLTSVSVPARADFKYTETSKITGGALKDMMKVAGIFNKQTAQAMQPVVTTHYVKGNRLRTDDPDGKIPTSSSAAGRPSHRTNARCQEPFLFRESFQFSRKRRSTPEMPVRSVVQRSPDSFGSGTG
jgi:hypothetical protein